MATTTVTQTSQAGNAYTGQSAPSTTELPDLDVVPKFSDKNAERKWEQGQMAAAFRIFAKLGYADGVAGHISLRDPVHPHLFWINPYAKHFSQIRVSDLILVNEDGKVQQPTSHTVNVAGFIIHSCLHQMRPDVNAAVHMHSPYGRAWSVFGKPIEMLVQDSCLFYNDLSVYEDFGGTVLAKEEGIKLAKALGPKNKSLILQNHGNLGEAAGLFVALERACQMQLLVEAAAANGVPKRYVDQRAVEYSKVNDYTPETTYLSFQPEYEAILEETQGEFLN